MSKPLFIRQVTNDIMISDLINVHYLIPRCLRIPNVVLAGGVVVRLLDENAKYKHNDVDLFILNHDIGALKRCLKFVQNRYARREKQPYATIIGEVVTVYVDGGIPLQLILTHYKTVEDLLSNFDFDYVQCAITRVDDSEEDRIEEYTLICSKWAKQAHVTHNVAYMFDQDPEIAVNSSIFAKRIAKTINKGYRFPVCKFGEFRIRLDTELLDKDIVQYAKQHPIEPDTYESNKKEVKYVIGKNETIKAILGALEHNGEKYVDDKSGLFRPIRVEITEDSLVYWFNNKEFSDYIIVSKDNKRFHVHRVVLAVIPYLCSLIHNTSITTVDAIPGMVPGNTPGALPMGKVVITSLELEPVLRFAYGERVVDNNCNDIGQLLGLIRNSVFLRYEKLRECACNQLYTTLNRTKNHNVALDDIKMLLSIAEERGCDMPALNIDSALESDISAEYAVRLIKACYYTDKCANVLKWIEAHPKDSDGHCVILTVLVDGTHDLSDYLLSKVRTSSFVDFIFNVLSTGGDKEKFMVSEKHIPIKLVSDAINKSS
jgi:hypothetical protein